MYQIFLAIMLTLAAPAYAAGIQGGAHIGNPYGGQNAHGAIAFAQSMNERGVTFVIGTECESSCAIIWNLMRKKCYYSTNGAVLRQHSHLRDGQAVNVRSQSPDYWLKVGRIGPGYGWQEINVPGKYRCSESQMRLKATGGEHLRGGRGAFRQDRGRTPRRWN